MNRMDLEKNEFLTKLTQSVYDPAFTKALQVMPWAEWYQNENPLDCRKEYLETYRTFILKSELNKIKGLENFKRLDLINGTTQTFDEAYQKYANKRLRIFRGEYAYHRRICTDFVFIEDAPLLSEDFVIVSSPFCSTGDIHPEIYFILDEALRKNVPVIIDCAYFGTCYDIYFDFSHPAIESVSFSLTKGYGLGHIRSGIRFSNLDDNNPICQQNNYNHTILAAAKIGLYMMSKFETDFIPKKYKEMQVQLCSQIGLKPTKCIHLALGDKAWDEYKIDNTYNRVGLRNLIKAKRQGVI